MKHSHVMTESIAKVVIINKHHQVLVLTVGEYKERPDKAFRPDFPGGLVEPGESERDGAVREVVEETGIHLKPEEVRLMYAETKFYPDENKSVSKLMYVTHIATMPQVTLSWEHAAYEWVSLEQLEHTVALRPFYNEAIRYCFEINSFKRMST